MVATTVTAQRLLIIGSGPIFSSFTMIFTAFGASSNQVLVCSRAAARVIRLMITITGFCKVDESRPGFRPFFRANSPKISSMLNHTAGTASAFAQHVKAIKRQFFPPGGRHYRTYGLRLVVMLHSLAWFQGRDKKVFRTLLLCPAECTAAGSTCFGQTSEQ